MSRGRRPRSVLRDAVPIALQRGTIQMAEPGPDSLFDFMIAGTKPVAIVCVKYTEHIRALLEEISRECDDKIQRLRSIAHDTTLSCELWVRSRYGTWRFFRVTADAIVEIGRDGKTLGEQKTSGTGV
jgi:hypothetical protein